MLRAVRFTARFSLQIDPSTSEAIAARADRLGGVSRERVGHELRRMLGHPTRAVAGALAGGATSWRGSAEATPARETTRPSVNNDLRSIYLLL